MVAGAALLGMLVARNNRACPSGLDGGASAAPIAALIPAATSAPEATRASATADPSALEQQQNPFGLVEPGSAPTSPPPAARPAAPPPGPPKQENPYGVIQPAASEAEAMTETLQVQREKLFAHMQSELELSEAQVSRVRQLFGASSILSQGNPRISLHPIGRAECREAIAQRPLRPGDSVCGAPHMAAVYDRSKSEPDSAGVCIDQFEFPNIPCEYPVVHVSAREAAQLCEAVGKRLCDAHEWEGACAGTLDTPEREYPWGNDRKAMRRIHNAARTKVWAYGPEKNHALCATSSYKTPGCPGGGFNSCGSNTFPAGAFPDCVSPFGVYDLHGNAAEHMSLPVRRDELTSKGGSGQTEMKGSWFIFSHYEAHEDDCHWRAPDWHPSAVNSSHSHGNYHLGFRCCKSLDAGPTVASTTPASP
ncbi:MAG TPA: SUMF1/EgtB/PvdO family nonheme iron enzyme [Polyangiaceae bacterium]|nr:SUMF1/EgtB/PvdO family nonheme iron enzyme [Polyangiaceae bacterium]